MKRKEELSFNEQLKELGLDQEEQAIAVALCSLDLDLIRKAKKMGVYYVIKEHDFMFKGEG